MKAFENKQLIPIGFYSRDAVDEMLTSVFRNRFVVFSCLHHASFNPKFCWYYVFVRKEYC